MPRWLKNILLLIISCFLYPVIFIVKTNTSYCKCDWDINVHVLTFYNACLNCLEDPQRRIFEYHRVEIDTTKIVSRSAFEFTPLPSEYSDQPAFILHGSNSRALNLSSSSSLSSAHVLWTVPDIQPDNWLWLVQHTSTVGGSSAGLTCSEAVENLALLIMFLLLFCRCSDGIDRHRQEWLDYNCPEEVR